MKAGVRNLQTDIFEGFDDNLEGIDGVGIGLVKVPQRPVRPVHSVSICIGVSFVCLLQFLNLRSDG